MGRLNVKSKDKSPPFAATGYNKFQFSSLGFGQLVATEDVIAPKNSELN